MVRIFTQRFQLEIGLLEDLYFRLDAYFLGLAKWDGWGILPEFRKGLDELVDAKYLMLCSRIVCEIDMLVMTYDGRQTIVNGVGSKQVLEVDVRDG